MSKDTYPAPVHHSHARLFSALGVVAVALVAAGVVYLSRNVPIQKDFTENKFYSLTDGTREILKGIDTPVKGTFFLSEGKELPPALIGKVRDVESLLRQYEQKTPKGFFKIRKVNPAPDTEGGEQAALAGVGQQPGEEVIATLSVECLGKRENVDFLPLMRRDEQFEYEISRAITNVLKGDNKKKIGVMSALPIMGSMGPMMGGQQRAWVFVNQLKRDYEVKTVEMTAEKIEDDLDGLMVIHPAGITDVAQFAIDQFVLKGKPVVIMIDPQSLVAKMTQNPQNPQMAMMGGGETSSSVPKLTSNWGYSFDATQVVADMLHKTRLRGDRESPVFLTLGGDAINQKDPVTSGLSDSLFVFSGAFTGKAAEGLTEDILIKTSPKNQLVSAMEAQAQDDSIAQRFKSSDKEKILAMRLTGKFKTAFPDGKPKKADTPPDPSKPEEKKPEEKKDEPAPLKEMAEGKSGVVVLVADSDFLYDNFSVQMLGPNMAIPFNGNLPLGMNIVDQIAGDIRLVQIRSRGSNRKPFTKINAIETAANAKIQDRVANLQKEMDEANAKLSQLQAQKDPKQKNFLSPEQQNEIVEFRKKQADAQRQIREARKDARRDIDATMARMKGWNIIGVPILVALLGIGVAVVRRTATSAK
jgi:gliding motility-associatede transport system auxiliary component